MAVLGQKIRKVGKGQSTLYAVLRTLHFIPEAMGSQVKTVSRGLIRYVI